MEGVLLPESRATCFRGAVDAIMEKPFAIMDRPVNLKEDLPLRSKLDNRDG